MGLSSPGVEDGCGCGGGRGLREAGIGAASVAVFPLPT